jgi:hypothetical protein
MENFFQTYDSLRNQQDQLARQHQVLLNLGFLKGEKLTSFKEEYIGKLHRLYDAFLSLAERSQEPNPTVSQMSRRILDNLIEITVTL